MASGEIPSGITDDPDFRLVLHKRHSMVNLPNDLEYFPPSWWEQAIQRALTLSKSPDQTYHSYDVVDAWGMSIARITARWVYGCVR